MLKDHRAKIGEADVKTIEAALADAKEAMKQGGAERINAAREKLESAKPPLGGSDVPVHGGGADPGRPTGGRRSAAATEPKENVVDAEFVDVDDKEKNKAWGR